MQTLDHPGTFAFCEFGQRAVFQLETVDAVCQTAALGLGEATFGLLPIFAGTQQAKEIILGGQALVAQDADPIGLANGVLDEGDLLDACLNVAPKISRNAQT